MKRILYLLPLLLLFVAATPKEAHGACSNTTFGAYTCVQACENHVGSGVSTINCVFGSNFTTGHTFLGFGHVGGTSATWGVASCAPLPSITAPNTAVDGKVNQGYSQSTSTAACTVSLTGTANGDAEIIGYEIAGSTGVLDGSGMVYQGTSNQCPNITTATDGDFVFCWGIDIGTGGSTYTAGAGFTIMTQDTNFGKFGEGGVQTTHGSITPTWTSTGGNSFMATGTMAIPPAGASKPPGQFPRVQ